MDRLKRIIRAAVLLALMPAVLFAQDPTKDADEVNRFFNPTATTEIYAASDALTLRDALPFSLFNT